MMIVPHKFIVTKQSSNFCLFNDSSKMTWGQKLFNLFPLRLDINILISKYLKTMLCLIKKTKVATLISNLETVRMLRVDVLLYSRTRWCILVVFSIKDKWVDWSMYLSVIDNIIKVSQIKNCQMTRIGDLPFDYFRGSCNTFLEPNPRVLLCFCSDDPKVCYTWLFQNMVIIKVP